MDTPKKFTKQELLKKIEIALREMVMERHKKRMRKLESNGKE